MKTKSTLIIIATLIVGMVIGFLINGQITHRRYKKFVEYKKEDGFKNMFYHRYDLTEDQKMNIDPILDKYAKMNGTLMEDFRKEFDSTISAFHSEVKPFLTPEQLEKMEQSKERFGKRRQPTPHKRGHRADTSR